MTAQYIRKISLIVADQKGNGIELSAMRVVFTVSHITDSMPSTLVARVYNLNDDTINKINTLVPDSGEARKSFPMCVLQAGYEGNFGRIFQGQVKQLRRGAESNVDSYLDIFAADGDTAYNWGIINTTLAAGYSAGDIFQACSLAMGPNGVIFDKPPRELPTTSSPRGKAMFGMVRDTMTDLANTNLMTWGIKDSKLDMIPQSAYLPGEVIILTSKTGVIGVPELTDSGLMVRCLLNPSLGTNQRVRLDNASIAQYLMENTPIGLEIGAANFPPPHQKDGHYKVIYVDHVGDTRGNQWYSEIVCLSIDPTNVLPLNGVLNVPFTDFR